MESDKIFTLRPLRPEDAESLANQLNNKKVTKTLDSSLRAGLTFAL